jgi:hypothetical protein
LSTKIKSWLLPAFLILFGGDAFGIGFQDASSKASQLILSENPKWISLLHINSNGPQIQDKRFILSGSEFSPEQELNKTLALFFEQPHAAQCRFPARYFFLDHFLDLESFGLKKSEYCTDLKKYKDYVPFEQLNLIYASEVLASASSMMGHSFLNAKGYNINQSEVSHSISFFTELDSFNPAALIYDGLVSGMKGLFIVRPFDKDLVHYSQTEGRNIWSYTLDINDFDRQLIKLHIWELKELDIEYLFQSYNCATLTLNILSIANFALKNEEILFVSPLDVVKAANKYQMIKNIGVELSDDWGLKMLEHEIDPVLGQRIESMVFQGNTVQFSELEPESKRIEVEYLSYLIKNDIVKSKLTEQRISELSEIVVSNTSDSLDFDLSQFKNPINTPQDSILSTSLISRSGNTAIDFSFLPASHYLYGDNRQYFSESELKIGELTIRVLPDKANLKLQSLTLYSFRSLAPSSKIVPKVSGNFYLGYRQISDEELEENGFFDLSGGVGKSVKPHNDILLFSSIDLGLATDLSDTFIYVKPSIGAILNTISNGKILVEYSLTAGQFNKKNVKHSLLTELAWFGLKGWTFRLANEFSKISSVKENELQLGVGFHF